MHQKSLPQENSLTKHLLYTKRIVLLMYALWWCARYICLTKGREGKGGVGMWYLLVLHNHYLMQQWHPFHISFIITWVDTQQIAGQLPYTTCYYTTVKISLGMIWYNNNSTWIFKKKLNKGLDSLYCIVLHPELWIKTTAYPPVCHNRGAELTFQELTW